MMRCPDCGLIFANPQYDADELREIYGREFYSEEATCSSGRTVRGVRPDQRHCAVLWNAIIRRYPRLGAKGTRVLDYGCGMGHFLAHVCAQGAEGVGVEFSEVAARAAREGLGVNALAGAEETLRELEDGLFDFVSLLEVVEHLRSPRTVIDLAFRKLRKGGVVCIATPNSGSVQFLLQGCKWRNLNEVTHLAIHCRRGLRRLLTQAGFTRFKPLVFWGGSHVRGPVRRTLQMGARLLGVGNDVIATAEKP